MDFDPREVIKPHNSALLIDGSYPPRSVVGALFTLMPAPAAIVTLHDRKLAREWVIVARNETSVVVVNARADEKWSWNTYNDPDSATIRATWHPLSAVSAVHIVAVHRWNESFDDGTVHARETWAITIDGEEIVLDPMLVHGDPLEFCQQLMAARGTVK